MNPLALIIESLKRKAGYREGDASAAWQGLREAATGPLFPPQTLASAIQTQQQDSLRPKLTPEEMVAKGLEAAALAPIGHILYHGSPHKFSKFDLSKIGTGEGAQMYGHGLYFTELPQIAQSYHKQLTRTKTGDMLLNGNPLPASDPRAYVAALLESGDDATVRRTVDKVFVGNEVRKRELFDALDSIRGMDTKYEPAGAVYKVDVPDEVIPKMLDWDKPLSEQAPSVQEAINKLGIISAKNGEDLYWKLKRTKYGVPESMPAHPNAANAQSYAADLLKAHGIPGIKYLDAGSRTAGEGTYNYVLFDDQLPRILEVNGQPTGLKPWADKTSDR